MGNSRWYFSVLLVASLVAPALPAVACAQSFATPVGGGSPAQGVAEPLHHIAILGHVGRPGVYELRSAQPELTEFVTIAGGLTAEASGNIRLVRQGRGGQNLFYSPGLRVPLMNGDLLIAERRRGGAIVTPSTAATFTENTIAPAGTVQIGIVGLFRGLNQPVVLDVPLERTTVQGVLGQLNQRTTGSAVVTVIRPGTGTNPQVVTLDQAEKVTVVGSTVLVLDPRSINVQSLPNLPEPFRAPRWGRRDDGTRPQGAAAAPHALGASPSQSYYPSQPPSVPAPVATDRVPTADSAAGTPLIAPLPGLRPAERHAGNPGPTFFSPQATPSVPEAAPQSTPANPPLQVSPISQSLPVTPGTAAEMSPPAGESPVRVPMPQPAESEPADLFPPAPGASTEPTSESTETAESEKAATTVAKSEASRRNPLVETPTSQSIFMPLLIAAIGASTFLGLMLVLWSLDRSRRQASGARLSTFPAQASAHAVSPRPAVASPAPLHEVNPQAQAASASQPQQKTESQRKTESPPNILDALIENCLGVQAEPLALPHPLRIHGRPVSQALLRADVAAHETPKPHFLRKESPLGQRRTKPFASVGSILRDEYVMPQGPFTADSNQQPELPVSPAPTNRTILRTDAVEAKTEPGLLDRALFAVRGERS